MAATGRKKVVRTTAGFVVRATTDVTSRGIPSRAWRDISRVFHSIEAAEKFCALALAYYPDAKVEDHQVVESKQMAYA